MLGDRLPCQIDVVVGRETSAELEEGLVVSLDESVEDRASGWRCEGVEDVSHDQTIGKRLLAYKCVLAPFARSRRTT